MEFDKTILSIKNKLKDSKYFDDFITAYSISDIEDERAYNLGLYFEKLKVDDFPLYINLKNDLEYLRDFYDNKDLKKFFILKSAKEVSTKINSLSYFGIILGSTIIILGIIRQYKGLYKVTIGMKQQPVYHTGLLYVIFGIAILWASFAPLKKAFRYRKFYKKYFIN